MTSTPRQTLRWVAAGLCLLLIPTLLVAQTKPSVPAATRDAGSDISGMYSFLQEGEFVQVTVENYPPAGSKTGSSVSGFISRLGDLESDKGAFLDQFFSKGSLVADRLTFTTKPVHGIWFEFTGKVERGTAKSKGAEGYYVVRGTLKRYSVDTEKKTSSQSREVVFKSFPDLDTEDAAKPTRQ